MFVGGMDLKAAGITRIGVLEIIMHPRYNAETFDNDVALMLLTQPVTGVEPLEIIRTEVGKRGDRAHSGCAHHGTISSVTGSVTAPLRLRDGSLHRRELHVSLISTRTALVSVNSREGRRSGTSPVCTLVGFEP